MSADREKKGENGRTLPYSNGFGTPRVNSTTQGQFIFPDTPVVLSAYISVISGHKPLFLAIRFHSSLACLKLTRRASSSPGLSRL